MLRALVVLLLLANLAFFAWTQGWLTGLTGISPEGDRDPARLKRQVRPEVIRILPPGSVPASAPAETTGAAAATLVAACLEGGPYSPAELPAAEGVLKAALPAGATWAVQNGERAGVWLIYMGKYANREALDRKVAELKRFDVNSEPLRSSPELEPGLSLGRFESQAQADARMADLAKRGVRTARVINITPPAPVHTLRFAQADASLQRTLAGLKDKLPGEKGFSPCAGGA
jgi:hypothetical protein